MKGTFLLLLAFLAIQFTGYAQANNWSTFTSAGGHYSVSFPGKPTEQVQIDSSTGTPIAIHLAQYEVGQDGIYISSWTDMSQTGAMDKTIKQMLEDSRDGTIRAISGTDVKTTALVLTGEPYIEFTFKGPNDTFTGKDRVYFINKVQYALISLFSGAGYKPADVDKFLKSFKHL